MFTKKIGNRGMVFTFTEVILASVYFINGDKYAFLCDTYLGPDSMKAIMEYIKDDIKDKTLVIFNTHADYDHVWGNCFFDNNLIIAHKACREDILEKGSFALDTFKEAKQGEVELKLPDLTFENKICFEEEGVNFFYTPGHTMDSASCYDKKDKILFVGDNLERPIPYMGWYDVDRYIETLKLYKNFPADILLSSHSGEIDKELIDSTILYLEKIQTGKEIEIVDDNFKQIHDFNLKNILVTKYESISRKNLKEKFDLAKYVLVVMDCMDKDLEGIERALKVFSTPLPII